jgi:hypothetical protein
VGEVLAMGDQALMQMAGEQRDAFRPRVMPEEVEVMETCRLQLAWSRP